MSGFVVALQSREAGVTEFPGVPDSAGLTNLMRQQVGTFQQQTGQTVQDPTKYLQAGNGAVLGFTADRTEAQVFPTVEAARAAINAIPAMVRPAGLSVQPVD